MTFDNSETEREPLLPSTFRRALGPGLLMAGAAVGVSHLVQSTRAGAEYGFLLLGLVLLACVLKYPFLEFGPRYAAATGESLIAGYRRMGRWAIGAFWVITLGTFLIIQAGVTVVTAGLAGMVLGIDVPVSVLSAGVLAVCILLLVIGHYRTLDFAMKVIMSVLAASTLVAVAVAFIGLPEGQTMEWTASPDVLWSAGGVAFVLALLGWMPIPLDVAAWHSIWTQERARQTGSRCSVHHALADFHIGYAGATLLAAGFLALGALVMYGSGIGFSDSAVVFSGQLVDLYARTLGEWSRPIIAVAALTTMFSTTLAVADAYPRVFGVLLHGAGAEARSSVERQSRWEYTAILLAVCAGAVVVIHFFGSRFTQLVDVATTVSFLAAPVLAWMNLKLVTGPYMPAGHRPRPWLRALSWTGIGFLVVFSLTWLAWRLVPSP